MKLKTLLACAVLSVGVASAVPLTVATFGTSSNLNWGGCSSACTIPITFTFDGVLNGAPFNVPMHGSLTYSWAPVGTAAGTASTYAQDVVGDFIFTFTPTGKPTANLLTIDFTGVTGELLRAPGFGMSLIVSPDINAAPPVVTSDILNLPAVLTDWQFQVNFGNINPGFTAGGNINSFNHNMSGTYGSTPFPNGQIPEPASMLMAGAGLLAIGGLLRMKRRG